MDVAKLKHRKNKGKDYIIAVLHGQKLRLFEYLIGRDDSGLWSIEYVHSGVRHVANVRQFNKDGFLLIA